MDQQTQDELGELKAVQDQPVSPALNEEPHTVKQAMEGSAENLKSVPERAYTAPMADEGYNAPTIQEANPPMIILGNKKIESEQYQNDYHEASPKFVEEHPKIAEFISPGITKKTTPLQAEAIRGKELDNQLKQERIRNEQAKRRPQLRNITPNIAGLLGHLNSGNPSPAKPTKAKKAKKGPEEVIVQPPQVPIVPTTQNQYETQAQMVGGNYSFDTSSTLSKVGGSSVTVDHTGGDETLAKIGTRGIQAREIG